MHAAAGSDRTRVFIAGGGVAGLEALLALADLAGDRVEVTLAAPEDEFLYKPLTVTEPFTPEPAERRALDSMVADAGGRFVNAGLAAVDVQARSAELTGGETLDFDAAVICVGARQRPPFSGAETLRPGDDVIDIDALLKRAAEHEFQRFALIVPATGSWPLPIYELALLSRKRAVELSLDVDIGIITPEPSPLFAFGKLASDAVGALLEAQRITVRAGARAEERDGEIYLHPWQEHLDAGAIVALPELRGPQILGLPADQDGFLPIDEHARVQGADGFYAAGDATNFPIKHGGLGAQQADAAAEQIAAAVGAPVEPKPFHPVLRGRLITGDESLNLEADLAGGAGEGSFGLDYLWWPPQKIAGKYLAAELGGGTARSLDVPPEHGIEVEVSLDRGWHGEPLGWGDGGGTAGE